MEFRPSPELSLGVEIEVQLIDPDSLSLAPAAPRILKALNDDKTFKPEFFTNTVEIVTGVCRTAREAEQQLRAASERLLEVARTAGIHVMGAGTHPFAGGGKDAHVWDNARYHKLLERNQWIARQGVIFGLHVHVGCRSGDHAIQMMNGISPYLAYLLGLSASSPFLNGQDTGLAAVRPTINEAKPTSGPAAPDLHTWADLVELADGLKNAGAIQSHKELHWDVRPSPEFGTVEVRICDGQLNLRDSVALAALVHWLFGWIDERIQAGEKFEPTPFWRLRENKWRTIRWGLDAEVLVDNRGNVEPLRSVWACLLPQLQAVAHRLGSACYLPDVMRLLEEPGYLRQRDLLATHKSLRSVVMALVEEWQDDVDLGGEPFQVLSGRPTIVVESHEGTLHHHAQLRHQLPHHAPGAFRSGSWSELPRAAGLE